MREIDDLERRALRGDRDAVHALADLARERAWNGEWDVSIADLARFVTEEHGGRDYVLPTLGPFGNFGFARFVVELKADPAISRTGGWEVVVIDRRGRRQNVTQGTARFLMPWSNTDDWHLDIDIAREGVVTYRDIAELFDRAGAREKLALPLEKSLQVNLFGLRIDGRIPDAPSEPGSYGFAR